MTDDRTHNEQPPGGGPHPSDDAATHTPWAVPGPQAETPGDPNNPQTQPVLPQPPGPTPTSGWPWQEPAAPARPPANSGSDPHPGRPEERDPGWVYPPAPQSPPIGDGPGDDDGSGSWRQGPTRPFAAYPDPAYPDPAYPDPAYPDPAYPDPASSEHEAATARHPAPDESAWYSGPTSHEHARHAAQGAGSAGPGGQELDGWSTPPSQPGESVAPATGWPQFSPADPQGQPPSGPDVPSAAVLSRLRRRRRQSATFAYAVALVLVLGAGAFAIARGTIAWPFGGGPSTAPATSSCPTPTPTIQAAGLTTVRVYNATDRQGFASSVAHALQKRGFTVPTVGNDLTGATPATAVIRYGAGGLLAARTLATQVAGTVIYQRDGRSDATVDLVLGTRFALVSAAKGAAALKAAPAPAAGCPSAG